MHTLRYHLGDEDLFELMERWNYPDSTDFDNTNGRLCRILNTDDMKDIAEDVTGRDMDPFFDVFYRETEYPFLHVVQHTNETVFTWVTENNVPLDLNVPLLVNGEEKTVEMSDGQGSIAISDMDDLEIDPDHWILMEEPTIVTSIGEFARNSSGLELKQNYPNPFHDHTAIEFALPIEAFVTISVYDIYGKKIKTLSDQVFESGNHRVEMDGTQLKPGLYICVLEAGQEALTIKMSAH
jgi:hypothetical protein